MSTPSQPAPLAYSVAGAARATSLGVTSIRGLLTSGELPRRYFGTKPIILAADLERWLRDLPETPPDPAALAE